MINFELFHFNPPTREFANDTIFVNYQLQLLEKTKFYLYHLISTPDDKGLEFRINDDWHAEVAADKEYSTLFFTKGLSSRTTKSDLKIFSDVKLEVIDECALTKLRETGLTMPTVLRRKN